MFTFFGIRSLRVGFSRRLSGAAELIGRTGGYARCWTTSCLLQTCCDNRRRACKGGRFCADRDRRRQAPRLGHHDGCCLSSAGRASQRVRSQARPGRYLGKRRIGHGELTSVQGLQPGNTTIRLVATDSYGRSAQAILHLDVTAVPAQYLLFDAPLLVSAKARHAVIRVASSAPATFTIAGKPYAVSQRLRTITVVLPRGKSLIRLGCTLRSRGGVIRGTYIALRAPR